ncbi:hypothetical protein EW146_g7379 [Bondarzewia mesenterica]|uniref:Major facilitator superfamily (MFS) profile domain-containing protein n=1 Tax=Bondarzewia mesenterica TaxID=1095465 RepID=A0A4S4LKY1_9AGAM|nr:hypothetical protein EW146_g7379 [Bondarzewia mesenterica]
MSPPSWNHFPSTKSSSSSSSSSYLPQPSPQLSSWILSPQPSASMPWSNEPSFPSSVSLYPSLRPPDAFHTDAHHTLISDYPESSQRTDLIHPHALSTPSTHQRYPQHRQSYASASLSNAFGAYTVEWLHRLPSAVHRLAAFASDFVEHFGRVPRRFHNPEDTHAGSNYPPIPRFKSTREYERSGDDKLPFILTYAEMKLLGIACVSFFVDGAFRFRICVYVPYVRALNLTATAYDLFIINPVATMLQFHLYGAEPRPAGLEGFVKAAANIGRVIGQFAFGYIADRFGRKAIYGKELMLIIFATILCISDPTGEDLSPFDVHQDSL